MIEKIKYHPVIVSDYLKQQACRIVLTIFPNIFIVTLSGCISPYDLKYDANEYLMVVDGKIIWQNTKYKFFLRGSMSVGSPHLSPINEVEIALFDLVGNSVKYIGEGNGEYFTWRMDHALSSGENYCSPPPNAEGPYRRIHQAFCDCLIIEDSNVELPAYREYTKNE